MRHLISGLLLGVIGVAALLALGFWQVHRLEWKEGLIHAAEERISAPPVALPQHPDPATDRYLAVRVPGRFTGDETQVLSSTAEGPGFLVIAAFDTDDGRRIMVDRGFVPEGAKTAPRPPRRATVIGNLNWPDDVTAHTPPHDVARDIWFGRDVPGMAEQLATLPLLVIAAEDTGDGIRAMPAAAVFRNDHLQYAITWFALALIWAGMTGAYLWRGRRAGA